MKSTFRAARLLLPLLLLASSLASCLSDPITDPEVRSRRVLGPQNLRFFARNYQAPQTGDMVVRWNHSATDSQQNFYAYYVRLYSAQPAFGHNEIDSNATFITEAYAVKQGIYVDTQVVFPNLPLGWYVAKVNGVRYHSEPTDTTYLSEDTARTFAFFDPRPIPNPTGLVATSINATQVGLRWKLPAVDTTQSDRAHLVVYYVDIENSTDSAVLHPAVIPWSSGSTITPVVTGTSAAQQGHMYKFWVKSVRGDQEQNFTDSATIIWAPAPRPPVFDTDGFTHSLLFVEAADPKMIDDSIDNDAQIRFTIGGANGQEVTLNAQHGAHFAPTIDTGKLDSNFYTVPLDANTFTLPTLTLPTATGAASAYIVYIQLMENRLKSPQYIRLAILRNPVTGEFVGPNGGLRFDATYQTGITKDGSRYLPYY